MLRCPRCKWIPVDFWKTLGCMVANSVSGAVSTPDRAWVPMGQQLGLPAARATRQEALGCGRGGVVHS